MAALLLFAQGQSDDLARKSARVKELMTTGRFAEAVPLCEELVRALPANPGLHLNLGLALQMSGRSRAAIAQFELVLKSDPNSLPALLSLGMARLEARDPVNAIAPLQKAVGMDASNTDARGMLAGALLTTGRAKEAAAQYGKLTAMTPADPKAWHGLGRSYEALSGKAFEELNKTAQGSPEWLTLVADSRMAQRQYRSAFFFYQQAIGKRPGFRPAYVGLSDVYRATNHADWANDEERRLNALGQPDCAREKAACDFAAGRYLEAAASPSAYWRARAYNELAREAFAHLGGLPDSVELHTIRADIAAGQRQYKEAAGHWNEALKLAPGDPRLEQQYGMALQQAGDYQASLPVFERLLARDAASGPSNFFLGEAYLRLEQPDQALPYLEKAVKLEPKLLPAHASLGLAYMRLGKAAQAIPHLEAALQIDEDASLHFQLARAYQAAGNAEKAKVAMAQYQAMQKRTEAEKRELEEKTQITAP
jgi:tetratricopeptide (TPR) repeat protein